MKIHLRDLDGTLVQAWAEAFRPYADVEVSQGDILDLEADALVSPANSFGFMDGGIDLHYLRFFGRDLQVRLQETLKTEWQGELPVGSAVVISTHHPQIPFLVSAPTMRVPGPVNDSVHAYLAFRAALRAAHQHAGSSESPIRSLLCPGLGTGVGRMDPWVCAKQMAAAYHTVRTPTLPRSLGEASEVHYSLMSKRRQ